MLYKRLCESKRKRNHYIIFFFFQFFFLTQVLLVTPNGICFKSATSSSSPHSVARTGPYRVHDARIVHVVNWTRRLACKAELCLVFKSLSASKGDSKVGDLYLGRVHGVGCRSHVQIFSLAPSEPYAHFLFYPVIKLLLNVVDWTWRAAFHCENMEKFRDCKTRLEKESKTADQMRSY